MEKSPFKLHKEYTQSPGLACVDWILDKSLIATAITAVGFVAAAITLGAPAAKVCLLARLVRLQADSSVIRY